MDHRVVLCEIDLGALAVAPAPVRYVPFPRFPAVKRDLSLLVPAGVAYATVEATIRETAGEHLSSLELFDIYAGSGIPAGTEAYGIRLKFQSAKGNLKGKTVDAALERILGTLAEQLSVRQRA